MQRRPADESLGRQFVRTREASLVVVLRWPTATGQRADVRPRAGRRRCCCRGGCGAGCRTRRTSACCCRRRSAARWPTSRLSLAGKVPVNLNFTAGREAMAAAIERCGIKTILTSRQFPVEGRHRADRRHGVPRRRAEGSSARPRSCACCVDARACCRRWALSRLYARDEPTATRWPRSSSRAAAPACPKGVMLTHRNILANVDAIAPGLSSCSDGRRARRRAAVLPLVRLHRHALAPAAQRLRRRLPPEPDGREDDRRAGRALPRDDASSARRRSAASYIRKCTREQFAHLRYAIVGAEKLREPVATAFKEKFGVDLLEGYGCTEMAPVVAVNAPDVDDGGERQRGTRAGSVGHPLPGVAAKIVDPTTGEGPLFGQEGLLLVNGPNRMLGLSRRAGEDARKCMRDGWYVTGDIATIDDARLHPHHGSAVALQQDRRRDGAAHEDRRADPGTARTRTSPASSRRVPDDGEGERLVALLHRPVDRRRRRCGNSCARPSCRGCGCRSAKTCDFVEAIPTLGTGKVDLRAVRQLASDRQEEAAS